jgi:hypothetical protein
MNEINRAPRPRARKIRGGRAGPFATACSVFEKGRDRAIEVSITPFGVLYRAKGQSQEHLLPHNTGFARAVALGAEFDAGPRQGRIRR